MTHSPWPAKPGSPSSWRARGRPPSTWPRLRPPRRPLLPPASSWLAPSPAPSPAPHPSTGPVHHRSGVTGHKAPPRRLPPAPVEQRRLRGKPRLRSPVVLLLWTAAAVAAARGGGMGGGSRRRSGFGDFYFYFSSSLGIIFCAFLVVYSSVRLRLLLRCSVREAGWVGSSVGKEGRGGRSGGVAVRASRRPRLCMWTKWLLPPHAHLHIGPVGLPVTSVFGPAV